MIATRSASRCTSSSSCEDRNTVSQVFLSFGIPFALIPLILFCRDPGLMGNLVNRRVTNWAAYSAASIIIVLNVFLLYETLL